MLKTLFDGCDKSVFALRLPQVVGRRIPSQNIDAILFLRHLAEG